MHKIPLTLLLPLLSVLTQTTWAYLAPLPITKHPYARDGFDPGRPASPLPTATLLPRIFAREAPPDSSLLIDTHSFDSSTTSIYNNNPSHTGSSQPSSLSGTTTNSSTSETPLQLAHELLDASYDNCNVPGGGCAVFNLTLAPCKTDNEVCQNDVTLAAMVCAQCNANQASVDGYNAFLSLCQSIGVANPSDTVRVPISGASAYASATSGGAPGGSSVAGGSSLGSTGGSSVGYGGSSVGTGSSLGAVVGLATEMPSHSGFDSTTSTASQSSASSGSSTSSGSSVGQSQVGEESARYVAGLIYPSDVGLASDSSQSSTTASGNDESDISPTSSPTRPPAVALLATDMAGTRTSAPHSVVALDSDSSSSTHSGSGGLVAAGVQLENSTYLNTVTSMSKITLLPSGATMLGSVDPMRMASQAAEQRLEQSKLALNAAIGFFSYQIDKKCDEDCGTWKSLSNTCTQDLCICTDPGVLSASACSSCLGSTTHGEQYQQQISYYSSFTANCTIEVQGLSPSGSGKDVTEGYDIVAMATSRLSSGGPSLTSVKTTHTAAAAEEDVVTVTAKGRADTTVQLSSTWWKVCVTVGLAIGLGATLV